MDPFFWGAFVMLAAETADRVAAELDNRRWVKWLSWAIVWLGGTIGYFTWVK